MIIANIIGGLGNQMFQYAAARALSLQNETELKLDISLFDGYELHQGFELERVFKIQHDLIDSSEIKKHLGWKAHPVARRLLKRLPHAFQQSGGWVTEPHFQYWPSFHTIKSDCYLNGYWQSEQYFVDYADQIRSDFTFSIPMDAENLSMAAQIASVRSVSLHVRRGDYASNPKTTATHGLCSPTYYAKAISYLREQIPDVHMFVFSDDIEWVRENLQLSEIPHTHVGFNRGASSWRDMQLMSLCENAIIANSSFSWWGAWLNPRRDKIVIAPSRWFAIDVDTKDLIPDQWLRM